MSSRIGRCPMCGRIAQHQDLPDDTTADLVLQALGMLRIPPGWCLRAAYCPDCETPYVVTWPGELSSDERYELAGFPKEMLRIVR